ncbi:hypothetical protein [Thiococcus pfennigii]|uniref:hypothetical protein n=1 Tax=Thiococcus pfennigii TaxID=1057 RepID=UPI0019052890|nr:hypothetical protein [Thiococcus pfennigii]MBK1702453.1 hypothetical protein [Thiococcus pfennigii]MBK1730628.1 hypothetical protein [Thiococcus pfennigii]
MAGQGVLSVGAGLAMVRRAVLLGLLALGSGTPTALAGDRAAEGGLTASPAAGWLELQRDQRVYRERVGPLSPREEADLRLLERRQGLDQQALEQRQRQQRQRPPYGSGAAAGAAGGLGLRQQQRREADEQRLDWRIEREVLGR